MSDLLKTLDAQAPQAGLSEPMQAMWWLAKGDWELGASWEKAHEICQRNEGTRDYDWVHALAHLIEGDAFNAGYWYRRCDQAQVSKDARDEWLHIVAAID